MCSLADFVYFGLPNDNSTLSYDVRFVFNFHGLILLSLQSACKNTHHALALYLSKNMHSANRTKCSIVNFNLASYYHHVFFTGRITTLLESIFHNAVPGQMQINVTGVVLAPPFLLVKVTHLQLYHYICS